MVGPDPRIGTVLHERYRIVERIGDGAMGAVYRGERVKLGRSVAVKFLLEEYAATPDGLRRFEVEARAMSRLAHPNCVAVTDFGVDDGTPYLVMEFAPGSSLRQILREDQRLVPSRAIAIVRQVLAGLVHAHGQGIVHRDIKPENILLASVEGHGEHVRILDFGLAKLRDDAIFTSGMALGTPGYMSPEQTLGRPVDERADVYATGILLHELIAGLKPFVSDDPHDVMRMHRDAAPAPLRQAGAQVSAELEAAVLRALAKAPDDRFTSASAFLDALRVVPEAGGMLTPPPVQAPAPRAPSVTAPISAAGRRRAITAAAAVGGLAVLLAIGLFFGSDDGDAAGAKVVAIDAGADADMDFEPVAAGGLPPEPEDVARIRARAVRGARTSAIRALEQIRTRSPERAEVHYALGNLMAESMWWTDSVEAYRMALALGPGYRSDERLIKDLMRALASDRAQILAAELLEMRVGAAAVPALEQAAKSRNPRLRARAARLLERIRAAAR
jgi:eukaryotic-like serine/threonine-protein kinase